MPKYVQMTAAMALDLLVEGWVVDGFWFQEVDSPGAEPAVELHDPHGLVAREYVGGTRAVPRADASKFARMALGTQALRVGGRPLRPSHVRGFRVSRLCDIPHAMEGATCEAPPTLHGGAAGGCEEKAFFHLDVVDACEGAR